MNILVKINKEKCQVGLVKLGDFKKVCSGGGWYVDSHVPKFKSIIYLIDVDEGNGQFRIVESSVNLIKELGTHKDHPNDNSQKRITFTNYFYHE